MLTIQDLKRRTENKLGFEAEHELFKDALRETVERFSVEGHKPAKTRRMLNTEFFPAECWFIAKWDDTGSDFSMELDKYDRRYDIKYPESGNQIQFSLPVTFSLSERQIRIWKKTGDKLEEIHLKPHNFVSGNTIILDEEYSSVAEFDINGTFVKAYEDVEFQIEINRWATPYPRGLYFIELEDNIQSIQKVVLRDKNNGFTYNLDETDLLSIDSDSRANNSYIHYDGCLLLFTSIDITADMFDVFVSHVDQNAIEDMIDHEDRWQEDTDLDKNYSSMYVCNIAIKILEWMGENSDQLKVQYSELNRWVKQYRENQASNRSTAVQRRIQLRPRRY